MDILRRSSRIKSGPAAAGGGDSAAGSEDSSAENSKRPELVVPSTKFHPFQKLVGWLSSTGFFYSRLPLNWKIAISNRLDAFTYLPNRLDTITYLWWHISLKLRLYFTSFGTLRLWTILLPLYFGPWHPFLESPHRCRLLFSDTSSLLSSDTLPILVLTYY